MQRILKNTITGTRYKLKEFKGVRSFTEEQFHPGPNIKWRYNVTTVVKKDKITFEKGDGELIRVQIADIFSQVCV